MRDRRTSSANDYWPKLFILALLLVLSAVSGQAQQSPSVQPPANGPVSVPVVSKVGADDLYRIGPGDVISVTVLDYAQLSSDAIRVDNRGMILLPMIEGEVPAACRTEGELAKEIGTRYLKYLKEPQVKVFVKDFQSQPVAVIGAVNAPGRFQLQRRVRLLELLTFVNGPADRAGQTIQIIHTENGPICSSTTKGGDETTESAFVALKLSETLRGIEKANPFVQAGDIITVPDADQYYILGNVAKPSAYPLKESVTLGQAIAFAGGTLPDTDNQRVRIVRRSAEGTRTEVFVNLKEIAKQQNAEFYLQPNDIVEVPKAGGAGMALKGLLRSMLPMVTQLPMRVIY